MTPIWNTQYNFPFNNYIVAATPVRFVDSINFRYDVDYPNTYSNDITPKDSSSISILLQYINNGVVEFTELATIIADQTTLQTHAVSFGSLNIFNLPSWFNGKIFVHDNNGNLTKTISIRNGNINRFWSIDQVNGFQTTCRTCRAQLPECTVMVVEERECWFEFGIGISVCSDWEIVGMYTVGECNGNSAGGGFALFSSVGKKPINEYPNKCNGVVNMWNDYPNNESYGYLTTDGKIIMTGIAPYMGGSVGHSGLQVQNSITYYTYPVGQGTTLQSYAGMFEQNGLYWIPVSASLHTHSPCRTDYSDGVSHDVSDADIQFAEDYPQIRHWVIGCGAIARFNSGVNFFEKSYGNINSICSNLY